MAEVGAGGGEHRVDGVAGLAGEMIAADLAPKFYPCVSSLRRLDN